MLIASTVYQYFNKTMRDRTDDLAHMFLFWQVIGVRLTEVATIQGQRGEIIASFTQYFLTHSLSLHVAGVRITKVATIQGGSHITSFRKFFFKTSDSLFDLMRIIR